MFIFNFVSFQKFQILHTETTKNCLSLLLLASSHPITRGGDAVDSIALWFCAPPGFFPSWSDSSYSLPVSGLSETVIWAGRGAWAGAALQTGSCRSRAGPLPLWWYACRWGRPSQGGTLRCRLRWTPPWTAWKSSSLWDGWWSSQLCWGRGPENTWTTC